MSTIYDTLNDMQREAVFHTEGPLLILAGAGSGKTRTLTHRISYLIDEKDVNPWNILAITFTNKAAGEMRERVNTLVDFGAESIWVSTFHSSCVRILRRHIEYLGFTTSFSIYDTDDQKTLLHQVIKKLDLDPKQYKDRVVMKYISGAKDTLTGPEEFYKKNSGDYRMMQIANIYTEYQAALKKNNALDFDDLIVKTVELFRQEPDVLDYYQERFRYIMVDEYQDTNNAQFELIHLLAGKYRNLCVVGDDDQSIYKFRGANIRNILDFEQYYPEAKVIRLEQNYRSTQTILDAANAVIAHNTGRKAKKLWTENEKGTKVHLRMYETAGQEAEAIANGLLDTYSKGCTYRDCAILYRTNAQSRLIEERCVNRSIPYQLVGGVNFYQRKEIKDILAYLKTIDNGNDDVACARIINVPKRGIGATTIGRVQEFADNNQVSFFDALCDAEYIPSIASTRGAVKKIDGFVEQIKVLRVLADSYPVSELLDEVLKRTGYLDDLDGDDTVEAQTRRENIEEFLNKARDYENSNEHPSLSAFLEEVALVADIDRVDEDEDRVLLMTLHSAKGLEFDHVWLCGMEDGLFPGYASINSDNEDDLEEERRLAYVGITRAKKELTLTAARQRMVNGQTQYEKISRFCEEIPKSLLDSNVRSSSDRPSVFSFGGPTGESGNYGGGYGSGYGSGSSYGSGAGRRFGSSYDSADYAGSDNNYGRNSGGSFGTGSRRTGGSAYSGGYGSSEEYSYGSGRNGSGLSRTRRGSTGFGSAGYDYDTGSNEPDIYGWKSKRSTGSGNSSSGAAHRKTDLSSFKVTKLESLSYQEGDRVRHVKFGEGTVTAIEEGKKDFQVTVDFDKAGTKVMFASFAKLVKVEEETQE